MGWLERNSLRAKVRRMLDLLLDPSAVRALLTWPAFSLT
jgi:hypothetical protein